MSNDSTHQHGAEGGSHWCIWGQHAYRCYAIHQPGLGNIRIGDGAGGGRCCPECKAANIKALDKLGVGRKAMYQ